MKWRLELYDSCSMLGVRNLEDGAHYDGAFLSGEAETLGLEDGDVVIVSDEGFEGARELAVEYPSSTANIYTGGITICASGLRKVLGTIPRGSLYYKKEVEL